MDKHRVVIVDCPWKYNDRRSTRLDNPTKTPKFGIGAPGNYAAGCMGMDELTVLGPLVQAVTTPDAYLFMWATCPLLPVAIDLLKAWGWKYVGVAFVWVKTTLDEVGIKPGPGYYTWGCTEMVLLGVRSKPWHDNSLWKPTQVIRCPHPRHPDDTPKCNITGRKLAKKIIHSRKPEMVQDRIDCWLGGGVYSDSPFLELFATRKREGWVCLGHEISGGDIADDLIDLERQGDWHGVDCADCSGGDRVRGVDAVEREGRVDVTQ